MLSNLRTSLLLPAELAGADSIQKARQAVWPVVEKQGHSFIPKDIRSKAASCGLFSRN